MVNGVYYYVFFLARKNILPHSHPNNLPQRNINNLLISILRNIYGSTQKRRQLQL